MPISALPAFKPTKIYDPASYDQAPKKFLDRLSTMADVADFVVDYINCEYITIILNVNSVLPLADGQFSLLKFVRLLSISFMLVVGIIATNWLIRADISSQGIRDPDCLLLAKLHSDAVDYAASLTVSFSLILQLKHSS